MNTINFIKENSSSLTVLSLNYAMQGSTHKTEKAKREMYWDSRANTYA